MKNFFSLLSTITLMTLVISSCGSGLEVATDDVVAPTTDDQIYRLNSIGDATFDTGCVNESEDRSMQIIAEFTYDPTASSYKITQTTYSSMDCNEEDLAFLGENTLALNVTPEDRRALLSIEGEEDVEVTASLGTYVYSSQMLTIFDDAAGEGAWTLNELQTDYPEYYPKSLTLETKMNMSGKPFTSENGYVANGSTHCAILYFDDEKMAASGGSAVPNAFDSSIVYPLNTVLYKVLE